MSIVQALDSGALVIEPRPAAPVIGQPDSLFNTTAVDLTLDVTLLLPKRGLATIIDPRMGNLIQTLATLCDPFTMHPDHGYRLDPDKFILGSTKERIALPLPEDRHRAATCLAARVEGKSSLARLGLLVHFTAPTIHAGFDGTITLEMMNLGAAPILLTPDLPICQLIIEEVAGVPVSGPSQFQGQRTPEGR